MTEGNEGKTPLDEALEVARQDSAQASYFYDALLNAELFVPVQVVGAAPTGRRIGPEEKFHPLFLTVADHRAIPVFSSRARLVQWAAPRTLDYLQLRCYHFLGVIADDLGLALNAATPWAHFLSPDLLKLLRNAMRPVSPS